MRFKKWNIGTPAERDVALLRSAGYPYLLSTVLAARGVTTAEADRSLSMSPMLMRDMDKAVARIQRAISQGETIAVFGDYDVDGITSTVLLMDYLKSCGVRCLRHIPRRIEEGYGLSKEAIQGLRDQGATLMITVDCGITGNEEVDFAASIGLDVVITDHHECKEELPRALAVVDPHRSDCPYPFKHLAGVGVALKLVLALGGESREDALFARYCTLAAIGTIADVMRMEGENRTIAFCGLEALPHTDFVGVHALLKEAGIVPDYTAGLSLGEYSALHCAGVLDAPSAISLVAFRGQAMADAVKDRPCGMAAVLNLDRDALKQVCEEASDAGVVECTNFNCPGQIVISGDAAAVDRAGELAKAAGAKRVLPLKVSGPFHTPLMAPAGDALAEQFRTVEFREPQIPVIFNCLGAERPDGAAIPELLVRQVQSSVYMEDSLRRMAAMGLDALVEIGPGKALSGFVKKTLPGMPCASVETPEQLDAALAAWRDEA